MDDYVKLAKQAVENYIQNKIVISAPKNLSPEFYSRKSGVFVTIHKGKNLRGCIGTFLPIQKNIAEEIISNAIAACARDYRFYPITRDELSELNYEVSILSEPELVQEIEKHNPKKEGIIVRCSDGKCGLLLPNLEGMDTARQQIAVACQKGGINPAADDISLYSFTTEKHL